VLDVKRRNVLLIGAGVVVAGAIAAGAAAAASGDDESPSVHGQDADRAVAAATAAVPGTANAVERDSEDGATWEVEVRRADGSTVDVRLDQDYRVVVVEPDSEQSDPEGPDSGG
jgi:hypothetical protein